MPKPKPMTVGEIRKLLKWVIKFLEIIRNSLCKNKRGRLMVAMKGAPPLDIECPPPQDDEPPSDVCALLDAIIAALKKILAEFAGLSPTSTIRK